VGEGFTQAVAVHHVFDPVSAFRSDLLVERTTRSDFDKGFFGDWYQVRDCRPLLAVFLQNVSCMVLASGLTVFACTL
jgi:hypothetical protein